MFTNSYAELYLNRFLNQHERHLLPKDESLLQFLACMQGSHWEDTQSNLDSPRITTKGLWGITNDPIIPSEAVTAERTLYNNGNLFYTDTTSRFLFDFDITKNQHLIDTFTSIIEKLNSMSSNAHRSLIISLYKSDLIPHRPYSKIVDILDISVPCVVIRNRDIPNTFYLWDPVASKVEERLEKDFHTVELFGSYADGYEILNKVREVTHQVNAYPWTIIPKSFIGSKHEVQTKFEVTKQVKRRRVHTTIDFRTITSIDLSYRTKDIKDIKTVANRFAGI